MKPRHTFVIALIAGLLSTSLFIVMQETFFKSPPVSVNRVGFHAITMPAATVVEVGKATYPPLESEMKGFVGMDGKQIHVTIRVRSEVRDKNLRYYLEYPYHAAPPTKTDLVALLQGKQERKDDESLYLRWDSQRGR